MRTACGLLVLLLIAGCSSSNEADKATEAKAPAVEVAATECTDTVGDEANSVAARFNGEDFIALGDGGETATVSSPGEGKVPVALSVMMMNCMLGELGAPDSLLSEVGQTTALMGRQAGEWDEYEIAWSYHPENGASAVFTTSN